MDAPAPTSVYDLLQKATQARCALEINSHSPSASVKRFSAAECTMSNENRPSHLRISNSFIDAAVAKWEPVFKSATLSSPDVIIVLGWLKDQFGSQKSAWRLYSETSEDTTHRRHADDLELIRKVIANLVDNLVNDRKLGECRLFMGKEKEVGGDWSVVPDFRGLLIFDKITQLLHLKLMDPVPMTLVTMEDKTMTVARNMFKETETIPIVWPDADGALPDCLGKDRKKPWPIACQMDRYRTNRAVFYTMDQVLYFQRVGTELVRSQPLGAQGKGIAIDFVQYASWIMEAVAEHIADFDTWYKMEVLKSPSGTTISEKVNPTVKFALLPPVPLPSWLFDKALAFAPVTRIKLGNNACDAYDFVQSLKYSRWLPGEVWKSLRPHLPVVEIPCSQKVSSLDGHKVVAFGAGSNVVAKISTEATEEFRHECCMTSIASRILPYNTPRVIGVYEGYLQMMLLSYTGVAQHGWYQLSRPQLESILSMLNTLHTSNFHHHDVRPPNITVNHEGNVCIIDFGSSILVDGGDCEDCPDEDARDEILEVIRSSS
ncbi:hypothetical protein VKT23_007806 [Stygiomarasmius scandens]|uniref:Protein kinase domain-containing protein n=1 Tax=Marasmiellus scandens TaxID=2682957 RepID=A0ABR1JNV1_9AGAR